MKDHQIRDFVSELTMVSKTYGPVADLCLQIKDIVSKHKVMLCSDQIDDLTEVAKIFSRTQQLRERLSDFVLYALANPPNCEAKQC